MKLSEADVERVRNAVRTRRAWLVSAETWANLLDDYEEMRRKLQPAELRKAPCAVCEGRDWTGGIIRGGALVCLDCERGETEEMASE